MGRPHYKKFSSLEYANWPSKADLHQLVLYVQWQKLLLLLLVYLLERIVQEGYWTVVLKVDF